MIIFQKRIYRDDLKANPNVIYLFGDNTIRQGMGGQAGEMRGEPNALGIATKKFPGGADTDYFSDNDDVSQIALSGDLDKFTTFLKEGKTIVIPYDGLGTGLSELPKRAPLLYWTLYNVIDLVYQEQEGLGKSIPWEKPTV